LIVKNVDELLSHGNVEGRKIALDIIDYAIREIDNYVLTRRMVRVIGSKFLVGDLKFDLKKVRNIYVIGGGKGCYAIAKALEEILEDKITDGIIIEKKGFGRKLGRIRVIEGGHPIPDEDSLRGGREVVEIAKKAGKGDLVIACITGGCSALMTYPADGISLDDVRKVTDLLLKCGAEIQEINAVRKHISAIKGGRLATYIHPAELVNLIVIDEVRGLPWGPTVPDTTTFKDAVSVLKKYELWDKIPESVKKHLERADPRWETPKEQDFRRMGIKMHNVVLANSETVCKAAEKRARMLGLNAMILSTVMEGESREVGVAMAGVAREVEMHGRPIEPPCVIIVGGETTVTITGDAGEGGRNQEFVLGAATRIAGSRNIVIASVGTDGTDGSTDVAGGIVDGFTVERAVKLGIDIHKELMRHNSFYVLRTLGDTVYTGPTNTNVMDLRLLVVTGRSSRRVTG